MEEETTLDKILAKILARIKVNTSIEEWNVSNINSTALIDMIFRQDAVYGFQINETDEYIQLSNYHREAKEGTGSESLSRLELAFEKLAQAQNKPVLIVFDSFGQKDTEKWLIKNGYTKENKIYVKRFDPRKIRQCYDILQGLPDERKDIVGLGE